MRSERLELRFSSVLGGLALASALTVGAPAAAQTDDQRSGARAAANQGGQAFAEKRWADAVDLFTRAESLIHSPVHLLYLARSYERLGQLVKARESYIMITNEELPAGASQPILQAHVDAQNELDAIEPRLPTVSVVVQGGGPKPVTVTMDGVQVPPALLGVPRPVDPGEHRFEAQSEGMDSATSTISAREGRSETVLLTLHASADAPVQPVGPAPAAQPPVGYGPVAPQPAGGPPPEADSGHAISPFTWVAFGVGAVGLGVGVGFAVSSSSKEDEANKVCPGVGCASEADLRRATSLDDDARSAKTISIVGFVVGGVGVATGATLLVMGMSKKKAETTATVRPWVGLGSAGVSGRF